MIYNILVDKFLFELPNMCLKSLHLKNQISKFWTNYYVEVANVKFRVVNEIYIFVVDNFFI